jgi:restriction endonuclease S subunit
MSLLNLARISFVTSSDIIILAQTTVTEATQRIQYNSLIIKRQGCGYSCLCSRQSCICREALRINLNEILLYNPGSKHQRCTQVNIAEKESNGGHEFS